MPVEIIGLQIIGLLFALFMIYYTFLHHKRKEFTTKEYIMWSIVWIIFIIVTMFPQILDPVLKKIGFARAMDFFTVAGFIVLIGIAFYNHTIIRRNQRRIEQIIRKVAIEKKR